MRKVLIGTPSHDGRVDVWYCNSLLQTVKQSIEKDIYVHAIYTSYDSLIQRSRNSLVKIALEQGFDDLFFIDSDVEWDTDWFFNILNSPEHIVGGALIKKNDIEGYTVKITDKNLKYNNLGTLIEVDGVGTGFMKISKFALEKLWESSTKYFDDNGQINSMVFDVIVENGQLISEDYVVCKKWKDMGYKVWIDPTITCNHIGTKKYTGNLNEFIKINGYE
jgi:hypothetical protein